jgi:uncharacterized protein
LKHFLTIGLLIVSNVFMTLAWYGHLKFAEWKWFAKLGLIGIVFLSWGLAFFEYCFQVPANRLGYQQNGGPFSMLQLKIIQEVISLLVFVLISVFLFKNETFRFNHLLAMLLIVIAVYLVFKK